MWNESDNLTFLDVVSGIVFDAFYTLTDRLQSHSLLVYM